MAVIEYGEHGVACGVFRTQLEEPIQKWHGILASRLKFNLRCPCQRGKIVRRNFQGLLKRGKCVFAVAFAGKGDALQGPQLRIVWRLL